MERSGASGDIPAKTWQLELQRRPVRRRPGLRQGLTRVVPLLSTGWSDRTPPPVGRARREEPNRVALEHGRLLMGAQAEEPRLGGLDGWMESRSVAPEDQLAKATTADGVHEAAKATQPGGALGRRPFRSATDKQPVAWMGVALAT